MSDITEQIEKLIAETDSIHREFLQTFKGFPIIVNDTLPDNAWFLSVSRNVYEEFQALEDKKDENDV